MDLTKKQMKEIAKEMLKLKLEYEKKIASLLGGKDFTLQWKNAVYDSAPIPCFRNNKSRSLYTLNSGNFVRVEVGPDPNKNIYVNFTAIPVNVLFNKDQFSDLVDFLAEVESYIYELHKKLDNDNDLVS